ncbi:MAG TPA: hypothetical protein VLZ75_13015 [Chitinophagales bacterium]|nr:hypothetical protein [Chitinophagales bacterium]
MGYIIIVDMPEPEPKPEEKEKGDNPKAPEKPNSGFEGVNILFTKDNGEVLEIQLKSDELFVAKCTNAHAVNKVLSGKRESIALFSRPK